MPERYPVKSTNPVFPGESPAPYIEVNGKRCHLPARLGLKVGDAVIVERAGRVDGGTECGAD